MPHLVRVSFNSKILPNRRCLLYRWALNLQALHPAEHTELRGKLKESQDRGTIESALDTLSGALHANGLEGVDLSGRPKNLYGVMRKMKDKQKGLSQVYDVRALRVIVRSKTDCYRVLQQVGAMCSVSTLDETLTTMGYSCIFMVAKKHHKILSPPVLHLHCSQLTLSASTLTSVPLP